MHKKSIKTHKRNFVFDRGCATPCVQPSLPPRSDALVRRCTLGVESCELTYRKSLVNLNSHKGCVKKKQLKLYVKFLLLFLLSKISFQTLLFTIFIRKIHHNIFRLLSQTTIIFFTEVRNRLRNLRFIFPPFSSSVW